MTKKNKFEGEVKIKKEKSSLSEFTKRSLPTDQEVEEYDEMIEEEAREDEIEESLSEIYQDSNGDTVDVQKLSIKKKRGFLFWFFSVLFIFLIIGAVVYSAYYLIFAPGSGAAVIELEILGDEKVAAGEEFIYTIDYRNTSSIGVSNMVLEVDFGDDFMILDTTPAPSGKDNIWLFDRLGPREKGEIQVKGKIIGSEDSSNIVLADMTYMPDNFSSEFKKEASLTTEVTGIGLDFDTTYSSTALIGEKNELEIAMKALEDNYLSTFIIEAKDVDNIEFLEDEEIEVDEESDFSIERVDTNVWQVNNLGEDKQELIMNYKVLEKISDEQEFTLEFKQIDEAEEKEYVFYEEKINIEIMNSDLNLGLSVNDSKGDQGVDFGKQLDYAISYANKGDSTMKDVVIMAVLESELLDWTTLEDRNSGREKGNLIIWSKTEVPELAELEPGAEGEIAFSINVLPFREMDLGKKFEISSYAQFSIGDIEDQTENEDNRSNTIINKINSDLSLVEQVRYFNEDNIPVGSGPLPPKVGETTSFKVYWEINNNLHELNGTKVEVNLPAHVSWNDKSRASVGSVYYDGANHKVIWDIGRLPTSVYKADAEFNISITPSDDDKDKILVLLPGSAVSATDTETKASISKTSSARTTKLEDDEIAGMNNDGRVE